MCAGLHLEMVAPGDGCTCSLPQESCVSQMLLPLETPRSPWFMEGGVAPSPALCQVRAQLLIESGVALKKKACDDYCEKKLAELSRS